jgi:hypothetical protein
MMRFLGLKQDGRVRYLHRTTKNPTANGEAGSYEDSKRSLECLSMVGSVSFLESGRINR